MHVRPFVLRRKQERLPQVMRSSLQRVALSDAVAARARATPHAPAPLSRCQCVASRCICVRRPAEEQCQSASPTHTCLLHRRRTRPDSELERVVRLKVELLVLLRVIEGEYETARLHPAHAALALLLMPQKPLRFSARTATFACTSSRMSVESVPLSTA